MLRIQYSPPVENVGYLVCANTGKCHCRGQLLLPGDEKNFHVWGTAAKRLSSGKTLTPCTALFYFPGSRNS